MEVWSCDSDSADEQEKRHPVADQHAYQAFRRPQSGIQKSMLVRRGGSLWVGLADQVCSSSTSVYPESSAGLAIRGEHRRVLDGWRPPGQDESHNEGGRHRYILLTRIRTSTGFLPAQLIFLPYWPVLDKGGA